MYLQLKFSLFKGVRTIKILLFDSILEDFLLKEGIEISNDPATEFDAIVINAQNLRVLPSSIPEEVKVFIQLTGKPSDVAARNKYKDAVFFKEPEEIINELKTSNSVEEKYEPVAGDSFLGISYSNKGGVGKTTSAISIACCLAEMGCKTVLADFDFKGPNLATYFNIKKPLNYFQNLNEENIARAIVKVQNNLYVLPINSDIYMPSIKDHDLQFVCDYLQKYFQCVIIDTMIAPHENKYMWGVFERANLVYAITNQAKITMEETSMYAPSLILMGVKPYNIRIIINQYSPKQTSIKKVEKAFNKNLKIDSGLPKLAGVFPHNWDDQLKALSEQKYLNKEEWQKVCAEIPNYLNKQVEVEEPVVKKGFLRKLKSLKNR